MAPPPDSMRAANCAASSIFKPEPDRSPANAGTPASAAGTATSPSVTLLPTSGSAATRGALPARVSAVPRRQAVSYASWASFVLPTSNTGCGGSNRQASSTLRFDRPCLNTSRESGEMVSTLPVSRSSWQ